MEAHLKVRLFHRSTRHIALTPEGEKFLEQVAASRVKWKRPSWNCPRLPARPAAVLRVSLPRYSRLFEPAIATFMKKTCAVDRTSPGTDTDDGEGYDVVVRSGEMQDSGLKRRRLGQFRRILAASPDYLAQQGTRRAGDLLRRLLPYITAIRVPASWSNGPGGGWRARARIAADAGLQ